MQCYISGCCNSQGPRLAWGHREKTVFSLAQVIEGLYCDTALNLIQKRVRHARHSKNREQIQK